MAEEIPIGGNSRNRIRTYIIIVSAIVAMLVTLIGLLMKWMWPLSFQVHRPQLVQRWPDTGRALKRQTPGEGAPDACRQGFYYRVNMCLSVLPLRNSIFFFEEFGPNLPAQFNKLFEGDTFLPQPASNSGKGPVNSSLA